MDVIKRDGTRKDFNAEKIKVALSKANKQTNEMSDEDIDKLTESIVKKCQKSKEDISVEEIQDIVEDTLLRSKFNATAKSYILYRDERTRSRELNSKLLRDMAKKLKGLDIVNQNANLDEASFGGRKGEADSVMMKWFALNNCMSKKSRENHLNNEIYIHDLDYYAVGAHNCLSIPFDDLLSRGFKVKQTSVRPAGSINTAFQLVAVIFQLQSLQQFGGVSATHLDWTMVPYVRKSLYKHYIMEYLKSTEDLLNLDLLEMSEEELDAWIDKNKKKYLNRLNLRTDDFFIGSEKLDPKLYQLALFETTRELKQAVEGFLHNLNTLQSRSGNQLPFTSINYGTCVLPEGRMVTKAILEGTIAGIGEHHLTPIFPCSIFQYMKGVNDKPGTPNYDLYRLALKCLTKRIYPNIANCDWSGNAGYDRNDPRTYFSTMGK